MNDIAPRKTLHIAKKLMSLLGKFQITDDDDNILYECSAQWGWLRRPWRITRNGVEVAVVTQKLWSLVPKWNVETSEESFRLRGKFWSWRRHITVQGGRFDGAELKGGLFDMNFELSWRGQALARAEAKILTLRTRHSIELLDGSPHAELLTAILMTTLMMQKGEENHMGAAGQDHNPSI